MTLNILDGGMGQELIRRSSNPPSPMWSAQVMLVEPEIVEAVHLDYINAGADYITLNAYSATPERLASYGDASMFATLQQRSVDLAQSAISKSGSSTKIAGCLPPLVGSYRPDLTPDDATTLATYRRIVEAQADAVDVFLCETMASVREAVGAATAARETGKPVWVALTVNDDTSATLRSGEPIDDAIEALNELGVDAILINCSKPEAISNAWPHMHAVKGRTGAYANGFTSIAALHPGGTVDSLEARFDLGPAQYAEFCQQWVNDGATIIGGCCEVGPAHIAELVRRFR